MDTFIHFLVPFTGGILLGIFFFGGLWLTVKYSFSYRNPAIWFLGSLFLRIAIVVTGLYLLTDGQTVKLLAAIAGFLMVRLAATGRKMPENERLWTQKNDSNDPSG